MHRIAIIGLGQIGASFGMDIRGKFPGVETVGHDKDPEVAGRARKKGAVDRASYTLPGTVEDAAIVVIAVPVEAVREILTTIAPHLSPGAIVTDVSSTKVRVLSWAQEILPESVDFVGGHPMAGVETPGVEGAQSGLFQGATYALIPLPRTSERAVQVVADLVQLLGAKPFYLDPQEHDSLVAAVSHLPIALSIALMQTVSHSPSWREMGRLAAGSFRDVSRLASGSPPMHSDIFSTNRDIVLLWLDRFQAELDAFRALIEKGGPELRQGLDEAYEARDAWLRGRVGTSEADKAYAEVPRASEQLMTVFTGEKLAQIGRKFEERESNRRRGKGGA